MASSDDSPTITSTLLEIVSPEIIEAGSDFNEHSNLFDAGLDSLATMQLLIRIEQKFGVQIPASRLTKENFSTLADLGKLILIEQKG